MSIARAQMRVQVIAPSSKGKSLKEKLNAHVHSWEEECWDAGFEATVLVDPGNFRGLEETLRAETKGQGSFDVLSVAVFTEEEEKLA